MRAELVVRPETGLDVRYRDFQVVAAEGGSESRRGVSLNHDKVRLLLQKDGPQPVEATSSDIEGVLHRPHYLQVVVGRHIKEIEDLLEHPLMLTGDPQPQAKPPAFAANGRYQRRELYCFGASPEDYQEFSHVLRHTL